MEVGATNKTKMVEKSSGRGERGETGRYNTGWEGERKNHTMILWK